MAEQRRHQPAEQPLSWEELEQRRQAGAEAQKQGHSPKGTWKHIKGEVQDAAPEINAEDLAQRIEEVTQSDLPPAPNWVAVQAFPALSNIFPLKHYTAEGQHPMSRAMASLRGVRKGQRIILRGAFYPNHELSVEMKTWLWDLEHPHAEHQSQEERGASKTKRTRKRIGFEARDHLRHHTAAGVRKGLESASFGVLKDNPASRNEKRAQRRANFDPTQEAAPAVEVDPNKKVRVQDEAKSIKDLALAKKADGTWVELMLSLILVDDNPDTPHDQLLAQLEAIADDFGYQFSDKLSDASYQQLLWTECNPVLALKGILPSRPPELPPTPLTPLLDYTPDELAVQQPSLIVSPTELAKIFHLPDTNFSAAGVRFETSVMKPLEPAFPLPLLADPLDAERNGMPCIGILDKGGRRERYIGVDPQALTAHLAITGRTRSGKSEWLTHLMTGIVASKTDDGAFRNLLFIDPPGETAETLIARIALYAPEQLHRITLFDLEDPWGMFSFNPLDAREHELIDGAVAAGLEIVKRMKFDSNQAPRAHDLASQVLEALAEANVVLSQNGSTQRHVLSDVSSFLQDDEYRHLVMQSCSSRTIQEMFDEDQGSYAKMNDKDKETYIRPILRAFREFEKTTLNRRLYGSGANTFNVSELIADNRIIIVKGAAFGPAEAAGKALSASIFQTTMSTMGVWGRRRDPVTGQIHSGNLSIVVDEYPYVVPDEGPTFFAQAAKFGVALIAVMQNITQIADPLHRQAILDNTASKAAFRGFPDSAMAFAKGIDPSQDLVTGKEIGQLAKYHLYGNMLRGDGEASGPFMAAAPTPLTEAQRQGRTVLGAREQLISRVRTERYQSYADLDAAWDQRQKRTAIKNEMMALLKVRANIRNPIALETVEAAETEHDMSDELERNASDPNRVEGDTWNALSKHQQGAGQ